MTHLSERIAADVLKASGSGLQNYTMNGSRERIIAAASVADDLLEALQHILGGALSLPRFAEAEARAAIAKALGEQS
jgi:hypothetical protein